MAKGLISCTVVAASMWATPAIDAQTLSPLDQQLIVAAEKEPLTKVQALLRAGARPDPPAPSGSNGRETTALGAAAWRGDSAVVDALLAAGANPNKPSGGETPLMLAARRCHEKIARILIAAGADAKKPDLLVWALITAQQVGSRTATALAFVEAGTELNERGFGMTPLEAAVSAGEFAVARAMIAKGADVEANIAFAERQGKRDLLGWLKKAAAPEGTPTATEWPAGDPLPVLETLARRLEVRNAGEAPDVVPSDQDVKQAGVDIVTYLKSHPANADALVLWARLARVNPEAVSVRFERAGAEIASALDRAVKLAPTNADAHYWKGRPTRMNNQKPLTEWGLGTVRSIGRSSHSARRSCWHQRA